MIDLKTKIRGCINSDGNSDESDCEGFFGDISQADQCDHRSPKTDCVKKLPGEFYFQDSLIVQPVSKRTQSEAHAHHHKVRKSRKQGVLFDVEMQNALHVRRNFSQNSPEAPVMGRVYDNQSDDSRRREERFPWSFDWLKS